MQKLNIIIANAPMYNGNRGCVALSLSSMYLIDKILSSVNIPYTFYLPQSGHRVFGEYTFEVDNKTIKYTAIPDISCFSLRTRIRNFIFLKRYIQTYLIYKQTDYIFDIGQGDSFADIYGEKRFAWIFAQYKLGKKFNKPYCILPQTIGPFKDSKFKALAAKGISRAKCVLVRDKQSYNFVKETLPQKQVYETIDVAFFLPFTKKDFNSSFIHVGLNISALLWHGGYTQNNQFNLSIDYQKLICDIISFFLNIKNVKLHLIPHVVDSERGIENDYAISYDLYEKFQHPNLILAPLFLDPITAKGYIAGMDFFMGARMHSTIAAFSSGVPVVPMSYSRKFNGLFNDTLNYSYLADMKKDSNEAILQLLQTCFQKRQELKQEIIVQQNTTIKERKELLIKNIESFLNITC